MDVGPPCPPIFIRENNVVFFLCGLLTGGEKNWHVRVFWLTAPLCLAISYLSCFAGKKSWHVNQGTTKELYKNKIKKTWTCQWEKTVSLRRIFNTDCVPMLVCMMGFETSKPLKQTNEVAQSTCKNSVCPRNSPQPCLDPPKSEWHDGQRRINEAGKCIRENTAFRTKFRGGIRVQACHAAVSIEFAYLAA